MALMATLTVGSGVVFDLGIRGGPANAVVLASVVLAMTALGVHGNVRRAEARWLMLAALVPAAFLAVRVSPWLTLSNLAVSRDSPPPPSACRSRVRWST
jgi:heme/copper-type cytochrome/quinol oxidase subunit 3